MYRGITHLMLKGIYNWQIYYNIHTHYSCILYILFICVFVSMCACVCLGVTVEQVLKSNHKLKL